MSGMSMASNIEAPSSFHKLKQDDESSDGGSPTKPTGLKTVGIEDFDNHTAKLLNQAHGNSLLVMENFEKMKLDFKVLRNELQNALSS